MDTKLIAIIFSQYTISNHNAVYLKCMMYVTYISKQLGKSLKKKKSLVLEASILPISSLLT